MNKRIEIDAFGNITDDDITEMHNEVKKIIVVDDATLTSTARVEMWERVARMAEVNGMSSEDVITQIYITDDMPTPPVDTYFGIDPASPDGDYTGMAITRIKSTADLFMDGHNVDLKTVDREEVHRRLDYYHPFASMMEGLFNGGHYDPPGRYYHSPPTKAQLAKRAKVLKKRANNKRNRKAGR